MTDTRHDEPLEALLRELARVQRHHADRAANPALAGALLNLGRWQSMRLRTTYADLGQTPRFAAAMKFFEEDLYGGADFAQRDADLVKVIPAMKRLMPANVIETVAVAVELNALSQDLDRAVVDALGPRAQSFGVADYCDAYRRAGGFEGRLRQIRLIGDVGVSLDRFVRKRMLRSALGLMRKPAQLAGLAALQDFLERGFESFAQMKGAAEFLATIQSRETVIHESIVAGNDAPFPDPLQTADGGGAAPVKPTSSP
jgi:hypothetical protein